MLINKTSSYTSIKPDKLKTGNLNKIIELQAKLVENYANFKKENLILDFSNEENINLKEILLFSQKSTEHKKNKKSFVIVCNGIDFDMVNNELIVVPTFKEAEDVIEIEEIERDLGI